MAPHIPARPDFGPRTPGRFQSYGGTGEQITIERGRPLRTNFLDYPLLTRADTPQIEVHFLESETPWGGLGGPEAPPAAPALANAVSATLGRHARALPLGAAQI